MIPDRSRFETRLFYIDREGLLPFLAEGGIGLEKESLRVSPEGRISQRPHPRSLGSPLTHPHITTDFSEALLEFVTPVFPNGREALEFLKDLHRFTYRYLGDEVLWAASMPCILGDPGTIPLARYGTSHLARMKTVYRRGLGNRYGRAMQVIAGIHYNFSLTDRFWRAAWELEAGREEAQAFRSERYLALVRNLQRYGWLIPYLFGASPAVCASFTRGRSTDLQAFDADTLFYPFATSLRLGDIGYQNRQTEGTGMKACYDSLDAYIRSLTWAIETPCPNYERIGVRVGNRYEQLNANVLQIENEYYSTVRPKQPPQGLEKPTIALRRRGVCYVEARSLDLDPFEPLGIGESQLRFLGLFLRFCLLADSPPIRPRERRAIDENQVRTAHRGRDPGLQLDTGERGVRLRDWALHLLDTLMPLAESLDGGGRGPYGASLGEQREKVLDPDRTPSARILAQMRANRESFFELAWRLSQSHRAFFQAQTLAPDRWDCFREQVRASHRRREAIEASDSRSFEAFLRDYFAQRA